MVGKVKKPSQGLNTLKEHTDIKITTAKGNFFLTLQWNKDKNEIYSVFSTKI